MSELETLLKLMREHKVLELEGDGYRVKLSPEAFAVSLPAVDSDEAPCRCGHSLTAHNDDGLCLEGCEAAACAKAAP